MELARVEDQPALFKSGVEVAPPLRAGTLVFLAVIMIVAAGVRTYHLGPRSLWVDEMQSYLGATGHQFREYTAIPENIVIEHPPTLTLGTDTAPWWHTLRPDTEDIHPPLYFFVLRMWTAVFGWGEAATRSLSVVASVIAVGLLFFVVREWSGAAAGLGAAAVMAVAQPQIYMAQETRSYELMLAVALAATWAVALIERRGVTRARVIALAVSCVLMLLIHYYSVHVIAALAIYAGVGLRGRERRAALGAVCGAALLFAIAWGPVLYFQRHGTSGRGTTVFGDNEPDHFHQTFLRLGLIPARALYEPLPSMVTLSLVAWALVIVPMFLLRRRPDLLIWTIWIPMNVLPTLLIDLTHHTWSLGIERYTLPATLGIYALIGSLGKSFPRHWRYALPILAVFGCIMHIDQAYFTDDRRSLQKWRELASMYRELARPGDLTVFVSGEHRRYDYMYYLCLSHYQHPFPGPVMLIDQKPSGDELKTIRSYPGVMLIGDGNAAEIDFPEASVPVWRPILFLGCVARLSWDSPPAHAPATSASTSHTAPTSQGAASPRR